MGTWLAIWLETGHKQSTVTPYSDYPCYYLTTEQSGRNFVEIEHLYNLNVPGAAIDHNPALVQVMTWCQQEMSHYLILESADPDDSNQ